MKGCCLILGAGPGVGRALALEFAKEGYDIALGSRTTAKLRSIVSEVKASTGRRAVAFATDATDERSVTHFVRDAAEELGPPGVAIYNAATYSMVKPTELVADQFVEEFKVNVLGALMLAQQVAPAMKAAGQGSILFTGGGFADHPAAAYASLSAGKSALRNLTHSLAQELGQFGIHVATVTVHGFVQPGTQFDPVRIARSFVYLNNQAKGKFDIELTHK